MTALAEDVTDTLARTWGWSAVFSHAKRLVLPGETCCIR